MESTAKIQKTKDKFFDEEQERKLNNLLQWVELNGGIINVEFSVDELSGERGIFSLKSYLIEGGAEEEQIAKILNEPLIYIPNKLLLSNLHV